MKATLLKQRKGICYLYIGLGVLAVNFLLASTSLAQLADTQIAFMSNRSNWRNGEIYLMNPDGKRLRRLTKHPQYDARPAWSPDGQKITFMSFRDEHRLPRGRMILAEIYLMNPDGTNPINLTQSAERADGVSSWSPNGKQIAFASGEHFKHRGGYRWNIWVMDADGGNPRALANHDAGDGSPDWSPDGRQIAFHSERDRKDDDDKNVEIYVMNADGTNPINLTNHPAVDRGPAWKPIRPLGVTSSEKLVTLWGKVKRGNTYGVR